MPRSNHKSVRDARETELKELYKRRPELRDVAHVAEIAHGRFEVTLRSLNISRLESALDLARIVRIHEEHPERAASLETGGGHD